jgi:putative redox protein
MAVEITVTSTGGLDCTATHGPSGAELRTTPPVDNGGDGSSFSPTDLVATALGSCVLSILALAAQKHDLDLTGTTAHVEKHMSSDPPRRIVRLPVTVVVPRKVDPVIQIALERAARACPVKHSIAEGIDAPITFRWVNWP